jgi:mycothiol synthase
VEVAAEAPDAGTVDAVLALVEAADRADGAHPLSEPFMLRLRPDSEDHQVVHLVIRDAGKVLGYAQIFGAEAAVVVHPAHRHRGLGAALATALTDRAASGPLRVWAHGDHPAAAALALSAGFERYRVLWQMRRRLDGDLPEPELPPGITLRAFEPGRDEAAFLEVNNRAFADHPDQGGWTTGEVAVREREPWFDAAGFLLAERDGRLVGFHWTKTHDTDPPAGEVYVLGIDPDAQAAGLGRALTLAGLRHLRDRGLTRALLYVDESNPRAVALYTKLGFAPVVTNAAYRRTFVPANRG